MLHTAHSLHRKHLHHTDPPCTHRQCVGICPLRPQPLCIVHSRFCAARDAATCEMMLRGFSSFWWRQFAARERMWYDSLGFVPLTLEPPRCVLRERPGMSGAVFVWRPGMSGAISRGELAVGDLTALRAFLSGQGTRGARHVAHGPARRAITDREARHAAHLGRSAQASRGGAAAARGRRERWGDDRHRPSCRRSPRSAISPEVPCSEL